jgi:hypothetical protein
MAAKTRNKTEALGILLQRQEIIMSIAGPIVAFDTPASSARPVFSLRKQFRLIFARVADAVAAANERRANREIARFVARNGGLFNDEMERRIGDRFSRG